MSEERRKPMMQRDVHVNARMLLSSLQFRDGDFGSVALISGQPQRAIASLEFLDSPVKNFTFFGYTFWTGKYKGIRVTVGNGGYYAPDTAFVTEMLCEGGVDTLIRLGSCGAMRQDIAVGDLIVADKAVRGDGATRYYVDDDFIPRADADMHEKVFTAAAKVHKAHQGGVWTTDALFKETKDVVNQYIGKGAIAVDMITSPFFTVASLYKKKTAAILAVSDNLITGHMGFADFNFFDAQQKMIEIAFSVVA